MNLKQLYCNAKAALAANSAAKARANKRALTFATITGICLLAITPEMAMAAAAPWSTVADSVLGIFTNGLTRTIAIICVIACGIAAMAGKLSWDWAIKIIVGIVLIFGAAAFVDYIIAATA